MSRLSCKLLAAMFALAAVLLLPRRGEMQMPGEKAPAPVTLQDILELKIETKDFQDKASLKDQLAFLHNKLRNDRKVELPILVDSEAFKELSPDAPEIYDT